MRNRLLAIIMIIMMSFAMTACSSSSDESSDSETSTDKETESVAEGAETETETEQESKDGILGGLKKKFNELTAEEEPIDISTIDFELIREQLSEIVYKGDDELFEPVIGFGFEDPSTKYESKENKPVLFLFVTSDTLHTNTDKMYAAACKLLMLINDLAHEQNPDVELSSYESFGGLYNAIDAWAYSSDNQKGAAYKVSVNFRVENPTDEEDVRIKLRKIETGK